MLLKCVVARIDLFVKHEFSQDVQYGDMILDIYMRWEPSLDRVI